MEPPKIAPLKLLQKLPNGALAFVVPGELSPEEFPAQAQAFVDRIGASVIYRSDLYWLNRAGFTGGSIT